MDTKLILVLVASEIISLYLIYRVLRSDLSRLLKSIAVLISIVPIVGPVFTVFIFGLPQPNPSYLQNRGPRGEYTNTWISTRHIWKSGLKDINTENSKEENAKSKQ